MPASRLRAYRPYRDTLSEVEQQIRSARTCEASFIRGESGARGEQTATASQNERRELFRRVVRELIDAPALGPDRIDAPIALLRDARFVENEQPMSAVQLYSSLGAVG